MNEPSKTRLSIDLDALERQLQEARGQSSGVSTRAPRSDDPLAELARIVGQDDPFRAILAGDRSRAAAQGQVGQGQVGGLARNVPASRHEPRFTDEPRYVEEPRYADEPEYGQDHGYGNAPAYDAGQTYHKDAHHQDMTGAGGSPHGQDHSQGQDRPHEQDLAHGAFAQPGQHGAAPAHAGHHPADDDSGYHAMPAAAPLRSPLAEAGNDGHDRSLGAHAGGGDDHPAASGHDPFDAAGHHDAYADRHGMDAGAGDTAAHNDHDHDDDHAGAAAAMPAPRQRSRKGLYAVAAVLGVAVVGGGLAYGLKGTAGRSVNGEPVTIKADDSPSKVQPQNPGGVEIPNQNKQIYERVGQPAAAETKVVNREEQPLDINQMIRRDASRSIASTLDANPTGDTSPASATPVSATSGAAAVALPQPPQATNPGLALGEPKRVKTVSVKPDGSIVSDNAGEAKSVSAASQSPSVPAKPKPVAATPAASPATTPAAPRQAAAPAPAQSAAPARTADAQSDDSNATRPNAAGAPLSIAPTGTGATRSIAPARRVATTSAPDDSVNATASTNAPTSPPASGFAVQLAAPASEKEARDTFASLQKKFPADLASLRPTIRKAEVGDKTIFRLRVGPLSREDATSLCTRLQSSGGACFVAKN